MKRIFCTAVILAFSAGAVPAAELSPIGDWLVEEGYANIRIDNCNGKMWGIVAWEKDPGGIDKENPDATKKSRPILGMPILLGMAPTKPNRWEGEIYNSENGKLYSASITIADENTLQLEGCLFTNFLCGTRKWTRVTTPPPGAPPLPAIKGAAPPTKQTKKGPGTAPQSDVCPRIAAEEASRAAAKK